MDSRLTTPFSVLRFALGATATLAGLDKFFNILADWTMYLSPLALKVVPHQDKDVLASLQRAAGRPALAAGVVPGAASQTKSVRVTTTTTSRTERTVASPAAITRGVPPAGNTRGPPPVGPRR